MSSESECNAKIAVDGEFFGCTLGQHEGNQHENVGKLIVWEGTVDEQSE